MTNYKVELENSSTMIIKAKDFFLFSDGSLNGTYVEINGKAAEGITNLNLDFNVKNSIPSIHMSMNLLPTTNTFDVAKIERAFSSNEDIFDLEQPIFDFTEKIVYGTYIFYKRTNNTYSVFLTDRFNLALSTLNKIIPSVDSVKYQSVIAKYLTKIAAPIFKDCGIPILDLKEYIGTDVRAEQAQRLYDLDAQDLKFYDKIIYYDKTSKELNLPYNDIIQSMYFQKLEINYDKKFEQVIVEINKLFENKGLKLTQLLIQPMIVDGNLCFDISSLIPSMSTWMSGGYTFFDTTFHLLGGDLEVYQMNDDHKIGLSQEYLKFLGRLL